MCDVASCFNIPAKVPSPPGTTPLEGSGRAVHERERPGVGWNPLSLTEGEGAGGVEGKELRNRQKCQISLSAAKRHFIARHDAAPTFPRRQAALKALATQNPLPCGRGQGVGV